MTATSITIDYLVNDIPRELANRAHNGTSHVPETRGEQERRGYASQLVLDHVELAKAADTDEKRAALAVEFERYREGYRTRYAAMLLAKSRCVSTMIAGPSNFNTRRHGKASDTADRRTSELVEFRERALKAIRKVLQPELAPIMSGDGDAVERLTAKIAELEAMQARMKAGNAAIRKHRAKGPEAQIAALVELGFSDKLARTALQPDFCNRVGFPAFELTNNGANIRRLKERLVAISAAKSAPEVEAKGEEATFSDSPADNRVRVFFPGKPDAETRNRLKRGGFRWTPTRRCWQAYRNHNTIAMAKREAGVVETVEAPSVTTCGCPVDAPEADPAVFRCPCGDHCPDAACVAVEVATDTHYRRTGEGEAVCGSTSERFVIGGDVGTEQIDEAFGAISCDRCVDVLQTEAP